jgi:hypothetical protein
MGSGWVLRLGVGCWVLGVGFVEGRGAELGRQGKTYQTSRANTMESLHRDLTHHH